jgi:D-aminopeptidase
MGTKPRSREFGIELGIMKPGKKNSITDVEGVGVGHSTIIRGDDVRTGVTAIVPHKDNLYEKKVTAAVDLFNAYGKSTGLPQIILEGVLETPILLTETLNTWRVADSVLDYYKERYNGAPHSLNVVVGETNGNYLTRNFGRHIGKDQVFEAIDEARSMRGRNQTLEGNVGCGTPMTGYGFKGGVGTASRTHDCFTLGGLVQLNCGNKEDLTISGLPIGREIVLPKLPEKSFGNSIMMIIATDLNINSRQLWKMAKRAILGLARTGSFSSNGSGDFTISFSTGEKSLGDLKESTKSRGEAFMNPVYRATVEVIEEAIVNALFAAETMIGRDGNSRYALPLDQVERIFEKYNCN